VAGISELPDRIHPMIVKELHQSMRRASFVYPFLIMQVLAIAAMAMEFATDQATKTDFVGVMNLAMLFENGPFWNVVGGMCGVIMPLAGLMLMGQEVEEGNHELLLLTKLNRWSVVRGKFLVLWSISTLSFVSLMPYVVVRYFRGGVEFLQELACSLTVIGLAAVISSGAIGASSFRHSAARLLVFVVFLGSALVSGLAVLASSALATQHWSPAWTGVIYHINAFFFFACFVIFGMALARTRLRLILHFYEPHPRNGVIGLLVVTPFVAGMASLLTMGYAGGLGLLGMAFAAYCADNTPRGKPIARSEY
jgi:ABC-type transport system involved in multi-copper enzyme maturation permease subunit